jgi:tripartite-type tricarboxylate transporter receptor subunit TctC
MKMNRSVLVIAILVAIVGSGAYANGVEEAYPNKAIKMIIPFGAGGNTDLLVRSMAEVMQEKLGQPVIGVNVTGGGGTIGTSEALRSDPDGYTVAMAASGPLYTQPFIIDLQYDRNDYVTIAGVSYVPRVLVAVPSMPYDDVDELMTYAKQNPDMVQVGIAAVGATDHFGFEQLQLEQNVEFNLIPQGGGNAQKVAVIGGHVDIAAITVAEARPLVDAGQVKALGIMHGERDMLFPDLPTFAEQGYPVESGVGFYLIAPSAVPQEVVDILEASVRDTLSDPGYLETAKKLNLSLNYQDADAAAAEIEKFYNLYENLAQQIGLGQ